MPNIKELLKVLAEGVDTIDSASLNLEVSLRMKERPTESQVQSIRDAGAMLNVIADRLNKTEVEMFKIQVKDEEVKIEVV